MAFYTGQKRKRIYHVDLTNNDGVVICPNIAQFTTKKEALSFGAKMNRTSKKNNYNRKAVIRVLNVWRSK